MEWKYNVGDKVVVSAKNGQISYVRMIDGQKVITCIIPNGTKVTIIRRFGRRYPLYSITVNDTGVSHPCMECHLTDDVEPLKHQCHCPSENFHPTYGKGCVCGGI